MTQHEYVAGDLREVLPQNARQTTVVKHPTQVDYMMEAPDETILIAQPPVSPLQQYVNMEGMRRGGAYAKGCPVRIQNLGLLDDHNASKKFNGMVGDIVDVRHSDYDASRYAYDVRCPLRPLLPRDMFQQGHAQVKPSEFALSMALTNRAIFAGRSNLDSLESGHIESDAVPFVFLCHLAQENLYALSGGPGTTVPIQLPAKWGPPLWDMEESRSHALDMHGKGHRDFQVEHPPEHVHPAHHERRMAAGPRGRPSGVAPPPRLDFATPPVPPPRL